MRAIAFVQTSIFAALSGAACSAPDSPGGDGVDVDIEPPPTSTGPLVSATARPRPPGVGWIKSALGVVHRASVATCGTEISGAACSGAASSMSCKADSECTQAPHGKCIESTGRFPAGGSYCQCTYACATDADCGPQQACVCGGSETGLPHARCVPAACKTDADCAGGVCALSTHFNGCGTDYRLACKTPQDKCKSDKDCTGGERCAFSNDRQGGSWQCRGMTCVIGRPLVVEGATRSAPHASRRDWSGDGARVARYASDPDAPRIRDHYLDVAAMEHASVASFARFALELLALGAPADLLAATSRAMRDEAEHAQIAYGIAAEYGGAPAGPGPLPEALAPLALDVYTIAHGLVRDGCAGETFGAVEGRRMAEVASCADRAGALARIAEDELEHAVLAFRALRWLRSARGAVVDRAAQDALGEVRRSLAAMRPTDLVRPEHGVLSYEEMRALRAAALETIVAPAIERMTLPVSGPSSSPRCAS